ncbi:hormogonium polysaccharide secretion pseudopilin HpsC [Cronbergia sp. UHCC 0137]|uniref:hormogonium polysaccharide secretion pseudopilin HpsC n=1 Tax=Cronbergia sp. UHCC 0137 TaxID=3110239 RepID=UPI002B1EBBD0|nr:hormogonium polysaccharide secretion pseudopilin HpsC [Cronbergia sp. UHCC 0137]MEA5617083.1 hormogonium polysaccharide secretion pseudopilin HpsC [Cronbergia sp. UHCC 0137]
MKSKIGLNFKNRINHSIGIRENSGFTMIELLVALIISFAVITPLLAMMVSIMNTEQKEQAKMFSEQEIQTALNYISRDLQQAVYIYDETGVKAIRSQLPGPTATDRFPVLVFWKRELVSDAITAPDNGKDDAFVYSLVAYYIIKESSTIWSNAARIGRWEIKDGVKVSSGTLACSGYTERYVDSNHCPDAGFKLFNINSVGNITSIMNKWKKKESVDYTQGIQVLVDYIDGTTTTNTPAATCPPNTTDPKVTWSKITPASFGTADINKMTGFYSCVDRVNTTAQIFVRGNAIARIDNNVNNMNYSDGTKTYFPTANTRVEGRGALFKSN